MCCRVVEQMFRSSGKGASESIDNPRELRELELGGERQGRCWRIRRVDNNDGLES